jgi:dolichol-phosphate mannosyltransferase
MLLAVRYPGVRDYSCGFRAYTADILRKLPDAYGSEYLCEDGFACMLELLFKLKRIHARATEVPLVLRYDRKQGESKMKVLQTMTRYGAVMWDGFFTRPDPAWRRDTDPEAQ